MHGELWDISASKKSQPLTLHPSSIYISLFSIIGDSLHVEHGSFR